MARKFNTKSGARQANVKRQVVKLRNKDNMSWANIAEKLDIAPRTVRRIFDEAQGQNAHFKSRPLPGGRPAPKDKL